jgi:F-type H+-transporting ATPase subunit epsilon
MAVLQVDIVTQEEQLISQEVDRIILPTAEGEITVLPGHVALTTLLQAGEVVLMHQSTERRIIVSPGFIQISDNKVVVLADSAVREEELDEVKAQEARMAAEQAMQDSLGNTEMAITLGSLERSIMELHAIQRRKVRH